MRQSKHTKWLVTILILAALALTASFAMAETGTLRVRVGDNTSRFSRQGIVIDLYQIGEMREDNTWWIHSAFSGIDILGAETTAQIDSASNRAMQIIRNTPFAATVAGRTDRNGNIVFQNLNPGIFLGAMQTGPEGLTMQSFLISVPYFENGSYRYDVTVLPKYTYQAPTPTPSPTPTPTPTTTHFWEELIKTYMPERTPTAPPTYTPVPEHPQTLTIIYIYEDGTPAWPTFVQPDLWPGTDYDVPSPVIPKYVPTISIVKGTMPDHDVVWTVIYSTKLINLDEYETPLGLGEIQIHVGVCYE